MPSALTFQHSVSISESTIRRCEWSPSGRLLAIYLDSGLLTIIDASGRGVSTIPIHDAQSIAWSPNEILIAVATSQDIVLIVDISRRTFSEYKAHFGKVSSVAFSPDGDKIASGGEDGKIGFFSLRNNPLPPSQLSEEILALAWLNNLTMLVCSNDGSFTINTFSTDNRRILTRVLALTDSAFSIGVSNRQKSIAIGCKAGSIYLTTGDTYRTLELEGHTSRVWSVGFAAQDRILVSESEDGTIKLWDTTVGSELESFKTSKSTYGNIAVHNKNNLIAIPNDTNRVLEIWTINPENLFAGDGQTTAIQYCSAKVALVGESNVGKSCLALRLAEGRYEEMGTTHGMRHWPVQATKLDPTVIIPSNEKREIILWDMGGQDEYRLIHQLFLHDTTVALILLDPTRGRTAFEEAEGWSKRLEKQIADKKAAKLLVGTKMDFGYSLVDQRGLERLVNDQNFQGFYITSAKTGRGIGELGVGLSHAIDWDSLGLTTLNQLFETVRIEIHNARNRGEPVLLRKELEYRVRSIEKSEFDPAAVEKVVSQLALQGLIVRTRLTSGEEALVLNIALIEEYAGSIINIAKNNRRGVPAVEESSLMSEDMTFPGITDANRLPRFQERAVLECIIQIIIERGVCIEHEGLLIFPTLFTTEPDARDEIHHAISLYYDFSGAIDNIYSSLISAITMSEEFGAVRLWDNRAEFTKANQGSCGLRKVTRQRGFAHLDVYFTENIDDTTRDLFISVVEEHLRLEGVDIYEHLEITCACGHQFPEVVVRQRISDGHNDVGCPVCDQRVRITEGARQARERDPEIQKDTWALRSQIRQGKVDALARAKRNIAQAERNPPEQPILILHLSDLHISAASKPDEMLGPLFSDLRSTNGGLGIKKLDYLVISGDISNRGQPLEFEIARRFVSSIISEFGLNAERCIVVPGNHDINWDARVYDWEPTRRVRPEIVDTDVCSRQGNGFLIRNAAYNERLRPFSEDFYHTLIQKSYPLDPEAQTQDFYFPRDSMQFICLNSCWEIDELFPERASINRSAIAEGLRRADSMVRREGEWVDQVFRIAVLHHPITGNGKVQDDAFLSQLQRAGVNIVLHGHVHESRADLVGYLEPTTRLHIIGAGSFGAPKGARPESTPRLYNVIQLSRTLNRVSVHTRCLPKDGAAWEAWAVWPGNSSTERRSYYEIEFNS